MVKQTLILALLVLGGCGTLEKRTIDLAQQKGKVQAQIALPKTLPDVCTALVGKVIPGDEPWVVSFKRQDILIDNRDDKTHACEIWWADYRERVAKAAGSS